MQSTVITNFAYFKLKIKGLKYRYYLDDSHISTLTVYIKVYSRDTSCTLEEGGKSISRIRGAKVSRVVARNENSSTQVPQLRTLEAMQKCKNIICDIYKYITH